MRNNETKFANEQKRRVRHSPVVWRVESYIIFARNIKRRNFSSSSLAAIVVFCASSRWLIPCVSMTSLSAVVLSFIRRLVRRPGSASSGAACRVREKCHHLSIRMGCNTNLMDHSRFCGPGVVVVIVIAHTR